MPAATMPACRASGVSTSCWRPSRDRVRLSCRPSASRGTTASRWPESWATDCDSAGEDLLRRSLATGHSRYAAEVVRLRLATRLHDPCLAGTLAVRGYHDGVGHLVGGQQRECLLYTSDAA